MEKLLKNFPEILDEFEEIFTVDVKFFIQFRYFLALIIICVSSICHHDRRGMKSRIIVKQDDTAGQ